MSTFQYFWRLIRYRPVLYLVNAVAWTLIYLAPIVPGLLVKEFFDTLTGQAILGFGVWEIIALLLAAAFARILVIIFGFITDVHYRFRMGMLVRRNLLNHILNKPGARAIPGSTGEAISQFRDDVEQSEEAVSWSVDVFGMSVFAAVSCYILIQIDAQMPLLVFLPLVIVVTAAQWGTARLQKYRAASREATSQVTGAISEMFSNVQAIQIAGAEKRMMEQFRQLNENRRETMLKDKLMNETLTSIFTNSVNIGTGFILLLAGQKMYNQSFTIGDFSLFVFYLTFVTQFIANFGQFLTYYKQMTVSFKRLTTLLQGASPKALTHYHSLPLKKKEDLPFLQEYTEVDPLFSFEAKGLTYRYPETGRGISDIHLRLSRQSFTVITGMIGSGKTTLIRALLGLLPKEAGEIRWNGRLIEDPGTFFIPKRSAYTAQIPRLYSDTLRENILMGQSDDEQRLLRSIRTAVMEEDLKRLQHGLETIIGSRGVKLSGGQAQRTAAARMFVREAELMVFDDLSSALDVETEKKLWDRLFNQYQHATCLVVSHRKTALQRADHIIVLKDGRVESEGKWNDLLENSEEFRKIWFGSEHAE